jgi:transmembrane sensor
MGARPDWEELRRHLCADWSPEREGQVQSAVLHRRQRDARRPRRLALLGVLTLAAAVGLSAWQLRQRRVAPAGGPSVAAAASKGPEVVALSPSTRLQELHLEDGPHQGYRLIEGSARFAVPQGWGRPFRVIAGDVTVEHVGTVFTVEILARGRVRVGVEDGRVRVRCCGGVRELGAGESWDSPVAARSAAAVPAASSPTASRARKPATPAWKRLAEAGAFDEAYRAMSADRRSVGDEPGDLLLAADAARLSGHPEQAVRLLQRVVAKHPTDPRSPLAAFTLGRVLLDELGRPGEAAAAFARAMGAKDLAEDALARQVQALAQAGDRTGARRLAEQYAARYPRGRRLRAVKKLGELP